MPLCLFLSILEVIEAKLWYWRADLVHLVHKCTFESHEG